MKKEQLQGNLRRSWILNDDRKKQGFKIAHHFPRGSGNSFTFALEPKWVVKSYREKSKPRREAPGLFVILLLV